MLDILHHHRTAAAGDIENAFDAQQIGAAQRDQRLHGAGEGEPLDRLVLLDDKARNAVAVVGLGDEAGALAGGRLDDALRIERAFDRDIDRRARIEALQALRQPLDFGRVGEIGLRDRPAGRRGSTCLRASAAASSAASPLTASTTVSTTSI